jgi:hypothetical protein
VDLRWWPVAIAGLALLATCIALATLLPMPQVRRRLRPLAHADRLTRLPEYVRVVRLQTWSMLAVVVLLLIMFAEALLAGARPIGHSPASRNIDAAKPEDIMICVGQPVTDPGTAGVLNYFAQRIGNFDTQRLGLTSSSLRVVPLTRDYQYAGDEFSRYAKLAALQQNLDANMPIAEGQALELRTGMNGFSRPLDYVDYARSAQDVLSLCIAGFPSSEDKTAHRRSLIYLGPNDIRRPDEQRPSLFSTRQVTDLAARAGIQVNVITGSDVGDLHSIATGTGGRLETYGGPGLDASGGTDATLGATLDRIRADPPRGVVAGETVGTSGSRDDPNVPLIAGVVVSVLACLSLAVLRR